MIKDTYTGQKIEMDLSFGDFFGRFRREKKCGETKEQKNKKVIEKLLDYEIGKGRVIDKYDFYAIYEKITKLTKEK